MMICDKMKSTVHTSKLRLMGLLESMANKKTRFICMVVKKCDLDLGDTDKNDAFNKSIRELITILFAVVLGVGLNELGNLDPHYFVTDLLFLTIGYITVVLSWWFYHKGTIAGPEENNILSYLVDCSLIIVYWFMINQRTSLIGLLILYAVMFLLYWIWEIIRDFQQFPEPDSKKVKAARSVNRNYFVVSLIAAVLFCIKIWAFGIDMIFDKAICIILISILVLSYRIPISKIYRENMRTELQSI